jgi:hypothetical protein
MAKRLGDNLTMEERLFLGQMTLMPGWLVLKKMIEEECLRATKDIMKLDPLNEKYTEILSRLALESRAINNFAVDLIESTKCQVKTGEYENEARDRAGLILRKKEAEADLNRPVTQSN